MAKTKLQDLTRGEVTMERPVKMSFELIQTSALLRIADALENISSTIATMQRRQTTLEARQQETDRKITSLKGSISRIRKEVRGE